MEISQVTNGNFQLSPGARAFEIFRGLFDSLLDFLGNIVLVRDQVIGFVFALMFLKNGMYRRVIVVLKIRLELKLESNCDEIFTLSEKTNIFFSSISIIYWL